MLHSAARSGKSRRAENSGGVKFLKKAAVFVRDMP
jgi:hypothetical protein